MTGDLTLLVILGLVAGAYLFAHFVVEWVQRRFLVVSGLEYILLGMLLGPAVATQVNALSDLTALAPVIAFAAGWVGLLYGMELNIRSLFDVPDRSVRMALTDVVTTVTAVWLACYAFLTSGLLIEPVPVRDALVASGMLAFAASAGSSSAVDLLRSRYPDLKTELLPLLRRAARMGDTISIFGFGILFCVFHEGGTSTENPQVFSDWVLITVILGIGLGGMFRLFLGETTDQNQRFLAMVGILVFASGAAFFVNVSALLVNLLLGFVIVNTKHGVGVYETLEDTQAPVRLLLLIFAGALWTPVDLVAGTVIALSYMALRLMAKSAGGFLATVGTPLRTDVFRGMMAQGDVAVAMAISFKLVYSGPAVDLAYTAILASVVVHEFVAPRLLKGLLVDAGELRQELNTALPAPPREARG